MVICNNKTRLKYNVFTNFQFKIDNILVENVSEFKYLGIILDENLTFNSHGQYIIRKITKKVALFQRKCSDLPILSKIQICQAIITPHFDYCSTLLFLLNQNHINKLQKLQNKVMRSILWVHKGTSVLKMCAALHWTTVKQRIVLNTLTFIFRIAHGLGPSYLTEKLITIPHACSTRQVNDLPVIRTSSTFENNSIFSKGAKLYNKLPIYVRNSDNAISFRRECLKIIRNPSVWKLDPLAGINGFWYTP